MYVSQRLRGVSPGELKSRGATWHRTCYKKAISHLNRDEQRSKLATEKQDPSILVTRKKGRPPLADITISSVSQLNKPTTRKQTSLYDKAKCIFCQPLQPGDPEPKSKQKEKLYNCRSTNKGKELQEIVKKSGHTWWPGFIPWNSYIGVSTHSNWWNTWCSLWYTFTEEHNHRPVERCTTNHFNFRAM